MITIKPKRTLLQILVSFTLENFYTNKQVTITIEVRIISFTFRQLKKVTWLWR